MNSEDRSWGSLPWFVLFATLLGMMLALATQLIGSS